MSSGQFLGPRERPLGSSLIDCFFFFFFKKRHFFFRSIWNLFALVGFSKTSTAFDLRASFWLDKKKVQINSKLNSNSYYYLEIIYSNHKPTVTDVLSH